MVPTAFAALIAKDLKLFLSDRRAVILAFAMPVAIGSFFGMLFPGSRSTETQSRIPILVVDLDTSDISRAMTAALASDKNLSSESTSIEQARDRVRRGNAAVGIVIPQGFGDAAGRAFFSGGEKPQLQLLYDPSRGMELAMVRGLITQHVMESVSREVFTGERGRKVIDDTIRSLDSAAMPDDQKRLLRDMLESVQRFNAAGNTASTSRTPGITLPYDVRVEAMTARQSTNYNGFAHSFAGMGLQFMLMGAINFAIEILVERQRGLWKRLRSAPISKLTLLGSKVGSGTVIGTLVMLVSFGFAILVWGVRIEGSVAGFIGVTIASAVMAASYGLLIAALGKTPNAARGVSVLATLLMVMLGGAWVPTFVFPAWLQRVTLIMPTRWAVDGLDAMTWRGFGLSAALLPILVLLGFAAVFWLLALARFRWEEV